MSRRQFERDYNLEEETDAHSWSVSYGDMISVLLTFFILLLSMSIINPNRLEALRKTIEGEPNRITSVEQVKASLTEVLQKQQQLKEYLEVQEKDAGLDVTIRNNVLFASGSGVINSPSLPILLEILNAFKELPKEYRFEIEGHTDDVPIKNPQYPSNWHLSTARALSVLGLFLRSGFSEERFNVQGFADTRPAFPNRDRRGRSLRENQEKNRRVVIKIR